MKRFFLFFSLLLLFEISYSQEGIGNITFNCGNKSLLISLPSNTIKDTLFNYAEGYYKTFFGEGGTLIEFQCGSLTELPFLKDTTKKVLYTKDEEQREIFIGIDNLNNKLWRLDVFKKMRLKIYFSNVDIGEAKKFNDAFNAVKLLEK
jgi:hypothetical protein